MIDEINNKIDGVINDYEYIRNYFNTYPLLLNLYKLSEGYYPRLRLTNEYFNQKRLPSSYRSLFKLKEKTFRTHWLFSDERMEKIAKYHECQKINFLINSTPGQIRICASPFEDGWNTEELEIIKKTYS